MRFGKRLYAYTALFSVLVIITIFNLHSRSVATEASFSPSASRKNNEKSQAKYQIPPGSTWGKLNVKDAPIILPKKTKIQVQENIDHTTKVEGLVGVCELLEYFMNDANPNVEPLTDYLRDMTKDYELIAQGELPATSPLLKSYLRVSAEDQEKLKPAHAAVKETVDRHAVMSWPKGHGIVFGTKDTSDFPAVLAGINWVRKLNADIPIEVVFPLKSLYEEDYCTTILSEMNTQCVVLEDLLDPIIFNNSWTNSPEIYKPLAILASSFEDVYYMNPQAMPLVDPAVSLDSDVYRKYGYVLNSDFWERTISPYFYDVAQRHLGHRDSGSVSSPVDILKQSDQQYAIHGLSTDAGTIRVNKKRQNHPLLLTLYYFLHSDQYDPLLQQQGPGEVCSNAWVAGSTLLGFGDYFQAKKRPSTVVYGHKPDGSPHYAILQPDPNDEYTNQQQDDHDSSNFVTFHAVSFKPNPKYMLDSTSSYWYGTAPLMKARYFGPVSALGTVNNVYDDLELMYFENIQQVACEWALQRSLVPKDWQDVNVHHMCTTLEKHTNWLKSNPEAQYPGGMDQLY